MFTEHVPQFAGKPVASFNGAEPFAFATHVPRLALDWEAHVDGLGMADLLAELLRQPEAGELDGIVFGAWDFLGAVNASVIVDALAQARATRLPKLRAVFLGDILDSEQELPWIAQSDVTPLLAAFPGLEELHVRGSAGLAFGGTRHAELRRLVIESAGLSGDVVRAVLEAELPALEHLELWLGSEDQGASVTMDLLEPLFEGRLFPKLTTLALKNAETADLLAASIAKAPLVERLQRVDLSLGTLSDEGAEALLASEPIRRIYELDLRKSFLSPEMIKRLHTTQPVIVDVRGSRFGKEEEGGRRPGTVPPRQKFELPLRQLGARRRRS